MSLKNQIALLAELIWQRKMNNEAPYVLLLGAGASITSGGTSINQIIQNVVEKHGDLNSDATESEKLEVFYHIIGRMGDDNRYTILKEYFKGKEPSSGYEYLASLIKNGYFRLIFTTNYDTFLEDALYDSKLRTCDFQTLVCGKDQPASIARLIKQPTPQIKVIKLHGDLNSRHLALLPEEIFQFIDSINSILVEYLNQNIIIVGHSMLDIDINRTITAEGGEIWYVNPEAPSLEQFIGKATRVRKSYEIHGEFGHFDNFFQALYEQVEQLSNHQKVTMKSPQSESTDFENRIYDLDFLCDPTKPRFIGIDAPAGYGKTYLLQEIQRRTRKTDWYCPLVDLNQSAAAHYDISAFLKEIGRQGFNKRIDGDQVEFLEKEIIKLFIRSEAPRILLLVDSVNLLQPRLSQWFRENFIPNLDSSLDDFNIKLRIVVAGRYLAADWAKTEYPFHIRHLDPFDEQIIKEMIHKFAQQYVGKKLRIERAESIAHEIYEISGGHPKSIRSILEELAQNMFITSASHEEHVKLFNKHVAYIVDEIMQGIPANIQQCLQILSVFRKFNTDTLDALINAKEITSFSDGNELLPQISGTRLIDSPSATAPMYSDRIVRRILSAQLKYNNPQQFVRLHQFAEKLYDCWIRSLDLYSKPLPIPVTDQWQLIFIIESLYHSLQIPENVSPTDAIQITIDNFKNNLSQIKSAFPGNLPNLGIQLKDALINDLEIINHLKYVFNENAFQAILEVVQHFIDNKGAVA